MTFKASVLAGKVQLDQIDDFIDGWHAINDWYANLVTLPGYLGFTEEEYALWVSAPESLKEIIYGKV